MTHDALREVENRCIAAAIAKQEEIGLRAATDGEYRRAYWHYDFVSGLDGVEIYEPEQKIQFKGGRAAWSYVACQWTHRFRQTDHAWTIISLSPRTCMGRMPKQTIPSPSVVHFRGGRNAIDQTSYPTLDGFLRRPR